MFQLSVGGRACGSAYRGRRGARQGCSVILSRVGSVAEVRVFRSGLISRYFILPTQRSMRVGSQQRIHECFI